MKKLLSVLLLFALMACHESKQQESAPMTVESVSPPSTNSQSSEGSADVARADKAPLPLMPTERKVIYTADIRMQVNNVDTAHRHLRNDLLSMDAYIISDIRTATSSLVENIITIRVRQDGFTSLLDRVSEEAAFIDSKNIKASDVTEEFVDVEARLKNRRIAEQQYQEIMKKAQKVSDILEVQEYLNNIRQEIETQQGRLQYLQNQTSYSTITVTMYRNQNVEPPVPREETFTGKLGHAIRSGYKGIQSLMIVLFTIWPLWLIGGPLLYGFWHIMRKEEKHYEKGSTGKEEEKRE